MKGKKSTIILVIILIVGLIMTTYPMVSNYFYQKNQKEIISTYIKEVKEDIKYIPIEKVEQIIKEAIV